MVLGGGYAIAAELLLILQPHWGLFLLLVFTGMFLAAYYTRVSKDHTYAFLQMGLVLGMVMIGSEPTLGNPNGAVQRLVGVIAGTVAAKVVAFLWPWQPRSINPSPQPPLRNGEGEIWHRPKRPGRHSVQG